MNLLLMNNLFYGEDPDAPFPHCHGEGVVAAPVELAHSMEITDLLSWVNVQNLIYSEVLQ